MVGSFLLSSRTANMDPNSFPQSYTLQTNGEGEEKEGGIMGVVFRGQK